MQVVPFSNVNSEVRVADQLEALTKRLELAETSNFAAEKRSADMQKDVEELSKLRGELRLGQNLNFAAL